MDMELGVHSILQKLLYSKKSQTGVSETMKGMMKSVSGKISSFERIQHEERSLQKQIIKEMNNMELFYRQNPFSLTNPKPHLEREVINSYEANMKRIQLAGIETKYLKDFIKNSVRTEHEQRKKYSRVITPLPHKNDYEKVYVPRNREAESVIKHENESGKGIDHDYQPNSHNNKKVSADDRGSFHATQKDSVPDGNGSDSDDSEEYDEVEDHFYNANGIHSQYEYCI